LTKEEFWYILVREPATARRFEKQTMMVGQLLAKRFALDDLGQVVLSRGDMGAVYDTPRPPTGELVAVKLSDQTSEV
jgi:hypothetical protein